MKLIKQAILEHREGTSDKVYEVDLCQVGDDQYVVNFRYGRRGGSLREGTKTALPVGRDQADRAFAALVASKTKKGYRHKNHGSTASELPQTDDTAVNQPDGSAIERAGRILGPGEQAIMERLRQGDRARRGAWKLDRAVWRAGELGLAEAEPLLVECWRAAKKNQLVRRYSIAWALGRCAARLSSSAIEVLEAIADDHNEAESTRRIAVEGLRRLYDDERRAGLIEDHIGRLPGSLAELAETGPAELFAAELAAMLDGEQDESVRKAAQRALETCYLIDNQHVRPGLLAVLRDRPVGANYFVRMRHIFKAAEFRRDGEVFGLLAYRFEKTPANRIDWYSRRDRSEPFRQPTRMYLRRRVWRTLRRLGRDGSRDFVTMAVGVLLPVVDGDAGQPKTRTYYRWRAPNIVITWDRFAGYWAFNHLLYGHSPRYYPDANSKTRRCRASYKPGDPPPRAREESFPHLWDGNPAGLLHLLDESECGPVHEFAAKALRANTAFLARIDSSAAIMLLARPYDVTLELGFELAERLYDPGQPDIELLTAVTDCRLARARERARSWIDHRREELCRNTQFMAGLAASAYRDNREYARNALRLAVLSDPTARALIGRLIALIGDMGRDEDERIGDIGSTLLACFGSRLASVGIEIIRDLIEHPAAAAQQFAGELLLNHTELARRTPDDLLLRLLDSPHQPVRATGASLLGQLPDSVLSEHSELLLLLSIHELADLRSASRAIISRLAGASWSLATDRSPGANFVLACTRELMHKQAKGVHSHLLALLRDELGEYLEHIDKATIWQLLHHKHPHAQELGGVLLASRMGPDDLSVAEIVKLSSHEILAVRRGAWAMCERAIDRLKRAMPTAIRLLDASWRDSREFAFGFFRDRMTDPSSLPTSWWPSATASGRMCSSLVASSSPAISGKKTDRPTCSGSANTPARPSSSLPAIISSAMPRAGPSASASSSRISRPCCPGSTRAASPNSAVSLFYSARP